MFCKNGSQVLSRLPISLRFILLSSKQSRKNWFE